jgi:AraC family transcriptional regulator
MNPDTVSSDNSVGLHPCCDNLLIEPLANRRASFATCVPTPAMEYRSGSEPENSLARTSKPQEWIEQVIRLLETADRQLDFTNAAHGAIVQAISLLRKQIVPREALGGGRGQLLFWQAQKVLMYIDSHITDRVYVAELGALVRCSEAHFSRLFKRTFGESPYTFVVRRRVELAARRMLDTEIPLSDVALSCGFTDQAHLTNRFRQVMHYTPSAWRRAQKTSTIRNLFWRGSPGDCAGKPL